MKKKNNPKRNRGKKIYEGTQRVKDANQGNSGKRQSTLKYLYNINRSLNTSTI